MLGFSNLAGAPPCSRCGSNSGDCSWLESGDGRCSPACRGCHGANVGRCLHCGEVVPCGLDSGRNPRPDARCTWEQLARLHAEDCRWAVTRGGTFTPMRALVRPLTR